MRIYDLSSIINKNTNKNADINVKKCLKFFDDIKHCDGIYHTIWLEENFKGSKNKELIDLLKNLKY